MEMEIQFLPAFAEGLVLKELLLVMIDRRMKGQVKCC